MPDDGIYTWGRPHRDFVHPPGAPRSTPTPTRPAACDWSAIDRALGAAIAAAPFEVIVALAPAAAEDVARNMYVYYEPMISVVIAIGHADRSISWTVTDSLIEPNEAALSAVLEDARRALDADNLTGALASLAPNIQRLRD